MAAINSITGDEIKTSAYSKQGRENHERIFSKKLPAEWAIEDGIIAIYGGCFKDFKVPISYQEFKQCIDLKNKFKNENDN